MRVAFVHPELKKLDTVKSDAFALCIFKEDWPLRGTPGLVDWRVGGHLSRMREAGWITCDAGEVVLMPLSGRLVSEKLLLIGMGSVEEVTDEGLRSGLHKLFSALEGLKAHATVMHLPGRPSLLAPEESMGVLLDVAAEHPDHDEIVLVEPTNAQHAMRDVYERRFGLGVDGGA